ncbi:MAG: toll/interleukin-1 receptor domain-containing protein [Pyrinomonadaceae bacterium]
MAKKSSPKKSYLVFISHSAKDRWIANQIAKILETKGRRHGIKVFLDEKDIEGGQSIPDSIRKNIGSCSEFLVLLTPNSIQRPWVLVEIGAAWGREKLIVAIINQVTPQEMPDIIASYKAIDLNNFEDYFAQLCERAKGSKK